MAHKKGSAEDPRDKFFAEIDIFSSHINLTPPTVLFFGGPHEDGTDGKAHSARAHILKYCADNNNPLHSNFVVPDKFKDWGFQAGYADLLQFETDMALMSTAIIIIPESSGSIAELGAFIVNEDVRNKLMVVMPDMYFNSESFIKSALIPRIADEQVYAYDYDPNSLSRLDEFVSDIVSDIETVSRPENNTEKFNQDNFGHYAYCIYQIALECRAIKFEELRRFLRALSLPDGHKEVTRGIYLLEILKFIQRSRKGNETFFLPFESRTSDRVRFSGKKQGSHLDKMTFKIELARYYKSSERERNRRNALDGQSQRQQR